MSKGIKRLLIAAVICILLGITLIAGVCIGGGLREVQEIMQNSGIFYHNGRVLVGNNPIGKQATSDALISRGTYSAEEIQELELAFDAGNFSIVEKEGDEIEIFSNMEITLSASEEELSVESNEKFHLWKQQEEDAVNIQVALPKNCELQKIALEVNAGELYAECLNAEEIQIELGAGQMTIDQFLCKDGEITVGAGQIYINNGTADHLDMEVGMGECTYEGSILTKLAADCGMGNMELSVWGTQADYDYEVECAMGNISIGDMDYSGFRGKEKLSHNAAAAMELACGMGNITVTFSENTQQSKEHFHHAHK